MIEHASLFTTLFNGSKSFDVMKKHFKAYVSGLAQAQELVMHLMATRSVAEVAAIVEHYQHAMLSRP
jgi:tRNA-dihydrouridine synthase